MAPGQGSKPRYCLNPTGNKEGAGKAAHGCLKYVPIQTFLSYQLGFVSESEKPLKTRGSKRSVEDPYWCCSPFPRETSTRTHSHTVSHTGRRMADSEKLLLSFLLPLSGSREVFKDNTAFIARCPGLAPSLEEEHEAWETGSSSCTRRLTARAAGFPRW